MTKPKAWCDPEATDRDVGLSWTPGYFHTQPLYDTLPTARRERQWVGLTEDEIDLFINGRGDEDDDDYVEPTGDGYGLTDADLVKLVRRAEAKLKEMNK